MRVAHFPPNWFASVMGTGIVAVAASSLPVQFPGLRAAAGVVWALAAALLLVVVAATVAHWVGHPVAARRHLSDPVLSHFAGAAPMAFLTVGAATLLVGRDWIGAVAVVVVDRVLWGIGTLGGIATAVGVPAAAFLRAGRAGDVGAGAGGAGAGAGVPSAFGGWLMPIVPPMVSASTGALLLPSTPAGQLRTTLLWGSYACFGLSLVASVAVIGLIWGRLAREGTGAAGTVPTVWIVLGPVGQSITAAGLLGGNAASAVDGGTAHALLVASLLYGFAMLGFALLWTGIALVLTVATARSRGGLPFGLTWWSFTFPVGTVATGLNGLAAHSGLTAVAVLAVLYFAGLVAAWALVAARTLHGARALLRAPAGAAAAPAPEAAPAPAAPAAPVAPAR
jgi:tellurite resistance protein TehA-like permease